MRQQMNAKKLFLLKEGRVLLGKRGVNFGVLVLIFLVAIGSVSFGDASITYLQHKMDNPFLNWVNIVTRQNSKNNKSDLDSFLNDSTMRDSLQFSYPEEVYVDNVEFYCTNRRLRQLTGRSVNVKAEGKGDIISILPIKAEEKKDIVSILPKILDESNVVACNAFDFQKDDLGLIITEAKLKQLGYTENPPFVYLSFPYDSTTCQSIGLERDKYGTVPVAFPVYAVVKQLPDMMEFLFSEEFLKNRFMNVSSSFDVTDIDNNASLQLVGNSESLSRIQKEVENRGYETERQAYSNTFQGGLFVLSIRNVEETNDTLLLKDYNDLAKTYVNLNALDDLKVWRVYSFKKAASYQFDTPSFYSVQLSDIEFIRAFQKALSDRCGIEIEMTSVDQKENFQFVQRMGKILSYLIMGIAGLFILVFLYFMLNMHFQHIQRNLGTFKAFGLSNQFLYGIYMTLLLITTFVAFVTAFAIIGCLSSVLNGLDITIEAGYGWLTPMVPPVLYLLIGVLIVALLVAWFVAKRQLKHTPGDLIYNRNQK